LRIFSQSAPHVVYVTDKENRSPSPLKIRAIKKAAFVSEGRLAFAGIDFYLPGVAGGVGGVGVCRCGRRRCPR